MEGNRRAAQGRAQRYSGDWGLVDGTLLKNEAHAAGSEMKRDKNPAFPENGMGLAINLAEGKRNWNGGVAPRRNQP
jgi:hypothetical protein